MRSHAGKKLWTPLDANNLELWLDSADKQSMTIDGSDGVSEWRDKSGNGNHFIQNTSSDRPKAGTREINGVNVVSFDGVNDTMLKLGGAIASSVYEIHMITDIDNTAFSKILKASNSGPFDYSLNTSTNLGLDAGVAMSANTPHSMAGVNIHGLLVNGFGSQIYTRGSTRNTANAGNGPWGNDCWLASDTGSFGYLDGKFGDVICFSGNDGAQRQKIEGYLAWKVGQQTQLATSHPYRFNPPYSEDI
jgi:hypothetical protein